MGTRSNDLLHTVVPNLRQDMEILVKTCLMPLALKTQNDSFAFVHELKQEMHADLKYVESLEDELDELESDKAEFSNMYSNALQECWLKMYCIVQLILFIVDSGCTKHMTGNLSLLFNLLKNLVPFVMAMITLLRSCLWNICSMKLLDRKGLHTSKVSINNLSGCEFCDADLVEHLHQLQSVSWLKHPQLKHGYASKTFSSQLRHTSHMLSKKDVVILVYQNENVDDYSRYTWTLFLRSKDETPEVLKDFLTMIQRNLQAPVISVRTDRGTEFLNKTLNAFFKEEGIEHQTSTPRTPEQNGVVERRNRTLVEAARTMLSASKLPLFFWAEAIATACYTQNRSIIIPTHEKTAYHIINDRKPSIKHLHIFGCTCYVTRDGENLDKMKEKGDSCILVGYSTQSKGYRVYNKRTRLIVESIHLRFDEIKEMSETSVANDTSGLVPQRQKASDYDNPDPAPELQNVFPSADTTVPSQQELDLLFGPLYDEFFNDGTSRVNKSSSPTDNSAPQDTNPSTNIHPTSEPSSPTNVHAEENNDDQAEFTNPFCTPVQEAAESSSRNLGNSNVHTFNQPQHSEYRWTKDHPLTQVCGNPSKPVPTRRQLATDPEMCMFALTEEGIDFEESFAPVARIVLFAKPEDFVDPIIQQSLPSRKALYGLKQAPRAWYDELSNFLISQRCRSYRFALDTRKSTSGGIQFLGDKLVSWMSKKQDCTAMSSAEAEYVALSASCVLRVKMWMRTQSSRLCFHYNKIPVVLATLVSLCNNHANSCAALPTKPYKLEHSRVILLSIHNDRMEILPETSSNSTAVGDMRDSTYSSCVNWISIKTLRFELETLSGDSIESPDHRNTNIILIHKDGDGDASFQLKSDSLPHAHAQTTKTFYKHQDSRIMKAQELKDKDFRTNSDIQDLPSKISSLSREIVSKLSR
ncbi:retrovirus-related pol polyprotein from transposon TNT 1-94 [Tanacetum coccineum]